MKTTFACLSLMIGLFLLTACDKDDDKDDPTPQVNLAYSSISGTEGSSFEFTENGEKSTHTGTLVIGWEGGSLLNLNYFRQLRFSNNGNSFALRFNIPNGTVFTDFIEGTHELYSTPVLLQNTQNLDQVLAEFLVNSSSPAIDGNATGTVTIERDVTIGTEVYSLVATLETEFYNQGNPVKVEGIIWDQEAPW